MSIQKNKTFCETYFGFVHNIRNTIISATKKLEENNNSLVIIHIFQKIKQLNDKFQQQQDEKFYGFLPERTYMYVRNERYFKNCNLITR